MGIRRGMTLAEMIVVAAVGFVLLWLIALAISTMRDQLKRDQTWGLLRRLDAALDAYHLAMKAWPASESSSQAAAGQSSLSSLATLSVAQSDPADAEPNIEQLAATRPSLDILDQIEPMLKLSSKRPDAYGTFQDAWGTRLHCLTAGSRDPVDRRAVAANRGKPIFVSASKDRTFVGADGSAAADNLRGDELPGR